jgi:BirA family biotin operon repressor/biotin-[acetyl-CoA-carboxylase] ligase
VTQFGRPHRRYRACDSTNERARALAEAGAPSGTVVTAAEQSAGRGRRGRSWSAPPGAALLYSAVLRPLDRRHLLLPLSVPLAVCDAIEALAPVECAVKWPNDVWLCEREAAQGEGVAGQDDSEPDAKPVIPGRKVAGILIEAHPPEWAVIGVGINLCVEPEEFPADLRWPATSVGHGTSPEEMLEALNYALSEWDEADDQEILATFSRRDALRGREIGWDASSGQGSGSGRAAGVADDGNLIVELAEGGRVSLGAGEVTLRLQ